MQIIANVKLYDASKKLQEFGVFILVKLLVGFIKS